MLLVASVQGYEFDSALVANVLALDSAEVEERLAEFTFPKARLDTPGLQLELELELAFGLAFLHEATSASPATELWATALARLEA